MNKVLNITYASSLTDLCEINSSFDAGVLRICYTGENRNKSYISKETIKRNLKTIYNCPIVCNYDRENDTLGGHDMEVVRDADGNLQLINSTTPVGVIPESAKVWFEKYEEDDGTVNEYLYAEALLWKRQEAYKKIKKDGVTAHSMEIKINSGKLVDDVYHVDDFEFNAFTLIGVTPCFESSALEIYSHDNFKQQMSEMMQDLKETFTMVKTSVEDDNIQNFTEGGKEVLENKTKSSKEELTKKFEESQPAGNELPVEEVVAKDASKEVPKAETVGTESEVTKEDKFALTGNFVEEMVRVLSTEKVTSEWGEHSRYCYADCDMEANEVYCWDAVDWLLYGFPFDVNGDTITIDYKCKKRKKYVIVDFEGEDQYSPIATVFSEMKDRLVSYMEYKSKFDEAEASIKSMKAELDSLRQFKSDADKAEAKEARNEVFAMFKDLEGIEAFEILKENCMEVELDELEEKCFAIRGRNGKFSMKERTPVLKVQKTDISKEPYGGLFQKYPNVN